MKKSQVLKGVPNRGLEQGSGSRVGCKGKGQGNNNANNDWDSPAVGIVIAGSLYSCPRTWCMALVFIQQGYESLANNAAGQGRQRPTADYP